MSSWLQSGKLENPRKLHNFSIILAVQGSGVIKLPSEARDHPLPSDIVDNFPNFLIFLYSGEVRRWIKKFHFNMRSQVNEMHQPVSTDFWLVCTRSQVLLSRFHPEKSQNTKDEFSLRENSWAASWVITKPFGQVPLHRSQLHYLRATQLRHALALPQATEIILKMCLLVTVNTKYC